MHSWTRCAIITCHVDSPKVVVQTAEAARWSKPAATTPIRSKLAPNGFITGAELKWGTVYTVMQP